MKKVMAFTAVVAFVVLGCETKKETTTQKEETKHVEQTAERTVEAQVSEVEQKPVAEEKIETAQVNEKVEKEAGSSTGKPDGEAIFKAKGCASCHQPTVDTVGPSLAKISKAYNGDSQKLIQFLKGNGKAIVDPGKFGIMAPQLNTTKGMSEDELSAMAEYILRH